MKYIQELREGERLSQIFFCKNKTIATTKAGKTYYSLTLQDKTGVLDGKVWELSGAIEHFENLDFIKIDGDVTLFNGSLQLNCRRIRKAKEGEYDQKDYFPVSEKDPEQHTRRNRTRVDRSTMAFCHAFRKKIWLADCDAGI